MRHAARPFSASQSLGGISSYPSCAANTTVISINFEKSRVFVVAVGRKLTVALAGRRQAGARFQQPLRTGDRGRTTGLGLAIVRAVARAHGGDVELEGIDNLPSIGDTEALVAEIEEFLTGHEGFYDTISIDGRVEPWFVDDSAKRFEAYGWNVIAGVDGHNPAAIDAAIQAAKLDKRVAIVERKVVVGGVCINTGTIPSKTLRETAVHLAGFRLRVGQHVKVEIPPDLQLASLMDRMERVVTAHVAYQVAQLTRNQIEQINTQLASPEVPFRQTLTAKRDSLAQQVASLEQQHHTINPVKQCFS